MEALTKESKLYNGSNIHIAANPADIRQFQGLVWQKYCIELNWFAPEDFPERLMTDRYDAFSTFILIRKGEQLIGGTRLVRDSHNGFPHERKLGFRLPECSDQTDNTVREKLLKTGRHEIAEVTRTVSSSVKNMISKDLAKAFYWYGMYYGIKAYFMVIDMPFFLLCHKINVPIHPISTPGFIDGSWTIPGVLFSDEIRQNISEKDPELWSYIDDQDNLDFSDGTAN